MAVSMLIVSVLLFMLLLDSSIGGETHSVTIITSPEQGPFRFDQTVNFSCAVEPAPPDNVTYQWWTVDSVYGGNTYAQKNFSRHHSYYSSHLRYCWYSCEVSVNNTLIGSASRLIELHGFLYASDSVVMSFSRGGRLQLTVNISTNSYARYITSLAWYHNGTRIASGNRFIISDNDTVLTVIAMEKSDAGVYEAKINTFDTESLTGRQNNQQCDSIILPLLESLAVHAPVTFTVQENALPTYNPLLMVSTHYITEYERNEQTIELRNTYTHGNSLFEQYRRFNWYRNGHRLVDGEIYNSTTLNNQIHSLQITYNDTNYAVGEYAGVLLIDLSSYDVYRTCTGYYYYANYYYFSEFPVAVSYFKILLRRPPSSVNLSRRQSVLSLEESTIIECVAVDGEPRDTINLTLWRNNELLVQAMEECLTYSTEPHPYGTYRCSVGNIHSNTSTIYEKVYLQLLIETLVFKDCAQLKEELSENLKLALNNIFRSLCPTCSKISSSSIKNVILNCTGTGQVYITADLVYSDPAGRVTASTQLNMFQTWMLSQESPSLMVNGTRVALNKQCPTQVNPVTRNVCINLTLVNDGIHVTTVVNSNNESVGSTSLIIAGFFGGIIAGMIIMAILTGLITCIKWLRSKQGEISLSENNKTVDIPMDSNQAYETVDVRYGTAGKGIDHEDTIYEVPAELSS